MDFSVKYSKGTLIQILIFKTFNLTMFEVPRIAINTIKDFYKLADSELAVDSKSTEVRILDSYSVHSEITNAFKQLCCESLSKTIRFWLKH